MNILAFDTCFDACSVAVQSRRTGAVTVERRLMRRGHAETLLPMIERTMQGAGLGYDDLDRIAVTHGPGTFTGSRVGMSAALGLSFAHRLPVVTYSSLQCVARAALDVLGEHIAEFDGVLVARDAKRDSLLVEGTDTAGGELLAPALLGIDAARRVAGQRRWFVLGSGASLLLANAPVLASGLQADWHASEPPALGIVEPDAQYMLQDAATRRPDPSPAPLYLRAPDATPSSRPPLARLTAPGAADV